MFIMDYMLCICVYGILINIVILMITIYFYFVFEVIGLYINKNYVFICGIHLIRV